MVVRLPILLGLRGLVVDDELKNFVRNRGFPAGFLLFARNIDHREQVRKLCDDLADLCGFKPLIAVDQEGGRVQRLFFDGKLPAVGGFGGWYDESPQVVLEAAYLHGFLLACELRAVGANWVLGPVLDLALPQTHKIIGDRAFAGKPEQVVVLAKMWADGVRDGGCLRCIKHAPGHGRAVVDSHYELPIVNDKMIDLEDDIAPFAALSPQMESMMTAHIRYSALDDEVATFSAKIIQMMRKEWDFKGVLLADDVGMKALQGEYVARVHRALNAGCDVVITALSELRAGMAGTQFAEGDWKSLRDGDIPMMNGIGLQRLQSFPVLEKPLMERVGEMRARFLRLWADGPGRMS